MNTMAQRGSQELSSAESTPGVRQGMVWISGGEFLMGSDHHYSEVVPAHRVRLDGFFLDHYPVTNREFAAFVADTGYRTVAERALNPADYPGAAPDKPGAS